MGSIEIDPTSLLAESADYVLKYAVEVPVRIALRFEYPE